MDFFTINKIHFIGIGGIGVSAIAKYFLALGKKVTGSDVHQSELTEELASRGVDISYRHQAENLRPGTDLVIYSPAVPVENPERQQALALSIRQLSYPEFLGELSRQHQTIAISGTNGKSTTTGMIGKIFEAAKLDPTVIVGTQVPGFDGNLKMGKSDLLIAEACEWKAHMLNLKPKAIVLTDLAPDHLDFYKDLDDLKNHFKKFIELLPDDGLLAYNGDDPSLTELVKASPCQTISWSINNQQADVAAKNIIIKDQRQIFQIGNQSFNLKIPGQYNIYNALAALTVARHFKINDDISKQALVDFSGCWRRFEILGPLKNLPGTLVISDYAHHPKALAGLIKAVKDFYPNRRFILVFQPHHYDRTFKLFKEFTESFVGPDLVIINEIYDVAGREKDGERKVSSWDLVKAINRPEVIYSPNLEETKKKILENVQPNDLILMVGAGDIDELARELI